MTDSRTKQLHAADGTTSNEAEVHSANNADTALDAPCGSHNDGIMGFDFDDLALREVRKLVRSSRFSLEEAESWLGEIKDAGKRSEAQQLLDFA